MGVFAFGLFAVLLLPVAAVVWGMLKGTQMPAFPEPDQMEAQ